MIVMTNEIDTNINLNLLTYTESSISLPKFLFKKKKKDYYKFIRKASQFSIMLYLF